MPPGNVLALLLLAILLIRHKPKTSKTLTVLSFLALYLMSTPFIAGQLADRLEFHPTLESNQTRAPNNTAIVILSGDRNNRAEEYSGQTVGRYTLERIRYGAHLQRLTGLPILVSGGLPDRTTGITLAELMAKVLAESTSGQIWLETKSRSTAENAINSQVVLTPKGIDEIYLVTQAWHMPRAVFMFEKSGFKVTPAPTGFEGGVLPDFNAFLPSASSLLISRQTLREMGALLWYRLRY